jgi:hypothetical protein
MVTAALASWALLEDVQSMSKNMGKLRLGGEGGAI